MKGLLKKVYLKQDLNCMLFGKREHVKLAFN